jgi:FkbM family methyltransferase
LRVDFKDIDKNSLVIDLGGYKGDWTSEIIQRYDPKVFIFEPLIDYHKHICDRFNLNSNVHPINCGLGARNETIEMYHSQDGSGAFVEGKSEIVNIIDAHTFFIDNSINSIDLFKINIEGGEYELLEYLILTGDILKIKKIQVQFHDFIPNAISRRSKIINSLAKTHKQNWNFYFVWEEWVKI